MLRFCAFIISIAVLSGCFGMNISRHTTGVVDPRKRVKTSNTIPDPTDFDSAGYDKFKVETPSDPTEEFFRLYSGDFPEDSRDVKVAGHLQIFGSSQSLALDFGADRYLSTPLCSVHLQSKVVKVTRGDFGYTVWMRAASISTANHRCLSQRFEVYDYAERDGLIGINFDYYNANTLRMSLKDAYVFFLRNQSSATP